MIRSALLLLLLLPLAAAAQEIRPDTVPPALVNVQLVTSHLAQRYPAGLREQRVGGTVVLRAFIDADGGPDSVHVSSSSGVRPLDTAAASALRIARFEPPALDAGEPGRWFEIPLQIDTDVDDVVIPVLRDRDATLAALQAAYPADMRRRGIHAAVVVLLRIDDDGGVTNASTPDRGCFPHAADAARVAAERFAFVPAPDGSTMFAATVAFAGDSVSLYLPGHADGPPRMPAAAAPRPGTSARPELRNTSAVQAALVRHYPANLRLAGIGGEAMMWFRVNERGRVTQVAVNRSSGHCELDLAAIRVAEAMVFTPARSGGETMAVWVEMPIRFSAGR